MEFDNIFNPQTSTCQVNQTELGIFQQFNVITYLYSFSINSCILFELHGNENIRIVMLSILISVDI